MLIDVHCHNDANNAIMLAQHRHRMASTISSMTTLEYQFNRAVANQYQLLSYGVHPWHAQTESLDEHILAKTAIVGEIGLDNVWTKTPLNTQRLIFEKQLYYAASQKKPVIFHVKGCEQELLKQIQAFPTIHKLVHWYSSPTLLSDYCMLPQTWFSVGPDIFNNKNVQNVGLQVPLDRLFIESDGLSGIAWALGQEIKDVRYYQIIHRMYQYLADLRKISLNVLVRQIEQNWWAFLDCAKS